MIEPLSRLCNSSIMVTTVSCSHFFLIVKFSDRFMVDLPNAANRSYILKVILVRGKFGSRC